MIGDNLCISISLRKSATIDLVQQAFSSFHNQRSVKPGTIGLEKNEPEVLNVENCHPFKACYNRFFLDYEGNDYGVLAYFSVVYYGLEREQCEMLSISPFNHPAGEFLSENNVEMTALLKTSLERLGIFELLIFTIDASYDTPMMLSKYKNREDEALLQTLYALK